MKKKLFLIITALTMLCSCAAASAYSDVRENDWFFQNVSAMSENGYLKGYEDGSFRPNATITKAEFTTVVSRVSGLAPQSAQSSHWADGFVRTALDKGYFDYDEIPPTGETYNTPINRQLAIKLVMKAFLPDKRGDYNALYSSAPDFADLDGRYYDPVIAAFSEGVVQGDEHGRINPKSSLTRAEACAIITRAADKKGNLTPFIEPTPTPLPVPQTVRTGGVSSNGALHVDGTQLMNAKNEPIILRGMSSHGLQWFPKYATNAAIRATADYGANLFRCAMYTAENGYLTNPSVKDTLTKAVDSAIQNDMYVIIDWHILSDGNPLSSVDAAKAFFAEMSARYAYSDAVLYEICNEPNGAVSWNEHVKPYAEQIIPVIRANTDAVILVGSPTWSQDLHEAAKNPLSGTNLMYTCHFYAGTHTEWLRQRIADCGLPVFVSEWGTSAADGNGGVFADETRKWLDFLNERKISWANWSLCDKAETSAALLPNADVSDGISLDELSESGKIVFASFK